MPVWVRLLMEMRCCLHLYAGDWSGLTKSLVLLPAWHRRSLHGPHSQGSGMPRSVQRLQLERAEIDACFSSVRCSKHHSNVHQPAGL